MSRRVTVTVEPMLVGKGWDVTIEQEDIGTIGFANFFALKKNAQDFARILYKLVGESELVIKDQQGKIEMKDTWPRSSDPSDIPG